MISGRRNILNVDIDMGMCYKTSGVNTNPTTDDQKWYVSYSFYRENGTLIGEKKFELDQSVASINRLGSSNDSNR